MNPRFLKTLAALALLCWALPAAAVGVGRTSGFAPSISSTSIWVNVTPPGADLTSFLCSNFGVQTIQQDPMQPSNLYTSFGCQGIWKSTDYGITWSGPINTGSNAALVTDCSGGLTISQASTASPPTVYQSCIRGNGIGFWKSTDGGVTWTNFVITPTSGNQSYFPPVVDPYNQSHLLMTGHEFDSTVESQDGGATWTSVPLNSGMLQTSKSGFVFFINTGTASTTHTTWLWIGDLTGGFTGTWRTTNSGTTWTMVDTNEHVANAQIYQPDTSGVMYMAGQYSAHGPGILRSTDYGQTWAHVGASTAASVVAGTSKNIYSMYGFPVGLGGFVDPVFQFGAVPGTGSWVSPGSPPGMTVEGASGIAVTNDGTHNILLGAMWNGGIWRYVEP